MRQIDGDALKVKILCEGVRGSGFSDTEREQDVCEMIDDMPTIEPKRGEWLFRCLAGEDPYECSFCGNTVNVHGYLFCPSCGADMGTEG